MQKVATYVGRDVQSERIILASLEGLSREPVIRNIPYDPKVIRRIFKRLAAEAYLSCTKSREAHHGGTVSPRARQ